MYKRQHMSTIVTRKLALESFSGQAAVESPSSGPKLGIAAHDAMIHVAVTPGP